MLISACWGSHLEIEMLTNELASEVADIAPLQSIKRRPAGMFRAGPRALFEECGDCDVIANALRPCAVRSRLARMEHAHDGFVTLTNDRRSETGGSLASSRGGGLTPRLHGAGSERPVRLG
jgi:hypothetical protein